MRKILIVAFVLLSFNSMAQTVNVEMELFLKTFSPSTSQLGLRIRAKSGTVPFLGATFYVLYQSANALPVSFDDTRMATGYGWLTSNRFTNFAQPVTLPSINGRTYDRRFVYGNVDESAGSAVVTLTTSWDTVLYITFNNLQSTPPQGGYAIAQKTSDAAGVALTDLSFNNIAIDVTAGLVALQSPTLPVLFTKFDAQCSNRSTSIAWSTSQEVNSNYFEVQKSVDGFTWKSVSRVSAAGNSSSSKDYQITDAAGGAAQYRLMQVDRDGKVTYSSVVRTNCDGKNIFVTLYPVPARDVLNLQIGSDKTVKTNLQVFDTKGRMVVNMPVSLTNGTNNFTIQVQQLPAGEYILKGTDASLEISKRFTVIR